MLIRVAGIVNDSIVDGPGLRLAVFVQGCPHDCPGCHNPETHSFTGGKVMNTEKIIAMMKRNPLISGITISGVEPMCKAHECLELARAAKLRGLNVWAYTGYVFEEIRDRFNPVQKLLLKEIDVLVDGPYINALRTLDLPWRGSSNQRLIDVQKSLSEGKTVLWDGGEQNG